MNPAQSERAEWAEGQAWLREHGMLWDDCDRRGRLPWSLYAESNSAGGAAVVDGKGAAVDDGKGAAVDDGNGDGFASAVPATENHPNWERHSETETTTLASGRFLRTWLRRVGRVDWRHAALEIDGRAIALRTADPDGPPVFEAEPRKLTRRAKYAELSPEARQRRQEDKRWERYDEQHDPDSRGTHSQVKAAAWTPSRRILGQPEAQLKVEPVVDDAAALALRRRRSRSCAISEREGGVQRRRQGLGGSRSPPPWRRRLHPAAEQLAQLDEAHRR